MHFQNNFDRPALYKALDERRAARNLTWAQVAREIRIATGTLTASAKPGPMETDGMLAMVRWLGCAPERFICSSDGLPVPEPHPQPILAAWTQRPFMPLSIGNVMSGAFPGSSLLKNWDQASMRPCLPAWKKAAGSGCICWSPQQAGSGKM